MKKREADFGVLFRHWIRANPPKVTTVFELKQTPKDSIPFDCLEEHQIIYNEAIKNSPKGILIRHQGQNGEPDYMYFYREPVYIVIKFPLFFCLVLFDRFLMEKSISKRKSLTSERARKISTVCIDL